MFDPTIRPAFIANWTELEDPDGGRYPGSDEELSLGAAFARLGLVKIGIHHERVQPGRRTSWPHAEKTEEEFVFVLEGTPDAWIDGHLRRLRAGDGVAFPAGTGIAHCFMNNTDSEVRLLVVGERTRPDNQIHYPLHPARNAEIGDRHWKTVPARDLGPHDGLPDRQRGAASVPPPSSARPGFVAHWRDIENPDDAQDPATGERVGIGAPFARLGLEKLGIHHVRVPPGRRTSWPHAESLDEEFVFVVEGTPDVWIDGHLHPLRAGDGVAFPAGTGIAHTVINNSEREVRLLVVGERTRPESKVHYPLHDARNAQIGERHWADAPVRSLGPHDGLPDRPRSMAE